MGESRRLVREYGQQVGHQYAVQPELEVQRFAGYRVGYVNASSAER
jgi:hypothetical protein